ncbi:MAG: hypothetical protein ACPKPY_10375 [Nitrososphaeraceae archaeon]
MNKKEKDIAIIQLLNPIYGSDKKTLKYNIISDNATLINLPSEFVRTTMIMEVLVKYHLVNFGKHYSIK